ncbi:hypothetical protein [Fournierella sp.]|uniref:hypothetical protein n=1 Tax=Allofournierella sp. TaxID=1940256 RepID=UPI00307A8433
MEVKINLEISDGQYKSTMEGTGSELMALLTIGMCEVLHLAKKPGVSNYALACDVAGAVWKALDEMDREESGTI